MSNDFGVMQGRLLPKYKGRYQAFPIGMWKYEFELAKECGLDLVEFIFDFNDSEKNPLMSQAGINEIISVIQQTGVSVKTICADYFMEAPLHSNQKSIANNSWHIMRRVIDNAALLGVEDIVIPCVDQSSLKNQECVDRFVSIIRNFIPILEKNNINFSLETDLAPGPFLNLIKRIDSKRVRVNYDIGNSASMGYNPLEELEAYGTIISDIHIKDRMLGGPSVVLGEGNANFDLFFINLKKYSYKGPFIMQAYRDEEGIYVFNKQLIWIKEIMKKVGYEYL